jgi:hypothetical protein
MATPQVAGHQLMVRPHALGAQAAARDEVVRDAQHRGDALLGMWQTEYGPVNRVVALWELTTPARLDATPTIDHDSWLIDDPVRHPLAIRRGVNRDALASALVEWRQYTPHPEHCETFVAALLAALPHRERYSPCIGVWTSREAGRNTVIHLWGYRSFDERNIARTRAAANPGWAVYRTAIRPLIASMRATLLTPLTP